VNPNLMNFRTFFLTSLAMTDTEKVQQLSELLSNVIHSLEMTKYEIEDVSEAANVVRDADHYHQQMLNILHSENNETN
jgi:hypothetical protein